MKIAVDENIPRMTVRELRDAGHDVLDVRGTDDEGIGDDVLWSLAQRQGRMLVTTDKGFSQYRSEPHRGILIVRLRQPNRQRIHRRVIAGVNRFREEQWAGTLLVVRDNVQSCWRPNGTFQQNHAV